MSLVELIQPTALFRDSYRDLVADFTNSGEPFVPFVLGFENHDFDAFLHRLDSCTRGIGVPSSFVAHSTFWLVADRATVVGVSNIRHSLTDALRREGGHIGFGIRPSARRQGLGTAILKRSLDQADVLGITCALLTCAKTNIASAKTIVRNRGILESEEHLPDRGETVQRYWIELGNRQRE